jgi:hypothetical protein
MRRILSFVLLFSCSAIPTYGCNLPDVAPANVKEVVNANGGWPISAAKCEYLNSQSLAIQVVGNATAIGNTSVAWTVVRVVDPNRNVTTSAAKAQTEVNTSLASQTQADSMMYDAIRQAIDGLDFRPAARQLARVP